MDGLSTLVQRVRHWSPVLRMPVAFHISSATRLGGMSAAATKETQEGASEREGDGGGREREMEG